MVFTASHRILYNVISCKRSCTPTDASQKYRQKRERNEHNFIPFHSIQTFIHIWMFGVGFLAFQTSTFMLVHLIAWKNSWTKQLLWLLDKVTNSTSILLLLCSLTSTATLLLLAPFLLIANHWYEIELAKFQQRTSLAQLGPHSESRLTYGNRWIFKSNLLFPQSYEIYFEYPSSILGILQSFHLWICNMKMLNTKVQSFLYHEQVTRSLRWSKE